MATPIVTTRILRRLLSGGVHSRAERLLARMHPADLGPVLASLRPDEIRLIVDMLFRQRRAAATLRELPPELLPQIFEAVPDERLASVFARLEIDDRVELVNALPDERRDDVLSLMPDDKSEELRSAERYRPGSAGQVMTTSYLALDAKMTAQEAIDSVRGAAEKIESILYLYVVDDERRLLGVVPIRRLVAAAPHTPVSDLMVREPVHAMVEDDQEDVAQLVARYDLLAIPVTDVDGTMVGVITVDDVIDVITEEATEDMYHLAGLSDEDRVFTSARVSFRKRLPWMMLNLVTVFAAATVMRLFAPTLERVIALAFFLPVVAGMSGNSGIQSLTVVTRAIALGELEFSSGLRAMAKEVAVSVAIGACTGVFGGAIAWGLQENPYIGVVLFAAMLLTMGVAGMLGAGVPLLLKALRLDPALGSGVIVTTATDAFGFFTFLGIATLMLDRIA
ncbi:MAG: magnesium transporter [Myxococcota bacterium]|nr:magnesium transporter [Myxococcales bacterium]